MNCGLNHQAYPPIVGSGNRSAILHYNTNQARLDASAVVLIDAGAEFRGYATDITRSIPVNGQMSPPHAQLYQIVARAQSACITAVRPGAVFRNLYQTSMNIICAGLLEAGYLTGDIASIQRSGVCNLFYPHGLGHSVGLDVHDPGDMSILKPNMVLTIEPGVYFNRAFIALANTEQKRYMVMDKINAALNMNIGGIRIEDVLLVTEAGYQVLSPAEK